MHRSSCLDLLGDGGMAAGGSDVTRDTGTVIMKGFVSLKES